MTETQSITVALRREDGYRFEVDWGLPGVATAALDEPAPVGKGTGPNAARLVAAAVAHCLSSSLLFCLEKSRAPAQSMRAVATAEIARNEKGRWRLQHLRVELDPVHPPEQQVHLARCRELFEDFCIVTESIRKGVPVDVVRKSAPTSEGSR